jgi:hypothetical protein
MPSVVAAYRVLDLDYTCAKVGQDHRAIRAREHAREIENGNAF